MNKHSLTLAILPSGGADGKHKDISSVGKNVLILPTSNDLQPQNHAI